LRNGDVQGHIGFDTGARGPRQLVDDTLNDAFGQRQITQYYTQLNTYPIVLEILPELQAEFSPLDRIYLKSPLTGAAVPMSGDNGRRLQLCLPGSHSHSAAAPVLSCANLLAMRWLEGSHSASCLRSTRRLSSTSIWIACKLGFDATSGAMLKAAKYRQSPLDPSAPPLAPGYGIHTLS
jgi:hypothetical protein